MSCPWRVAVPQSSQVVHQASHPRRLEVEVLVMVWGMQVRRGEPKVYVAERREEHGARPVRAGRGWADVERQGLG